MYWLLPDDSATSAARYALLWQLSTLEWKFMNPNTKPFKIPIPSKIDFWYQMSTVHTFMEYQKSTAWQKTPHTYIMVATVTMQILVPVMSFQMPLSNCQVYPISIALAVNRNKLRELSKSWKSVYVMSITCSTLLPSLWTLCRPLTVLYFPVW